MSSPPGLAVHARDFGLKGPRGWAFQGISADAEPGALIAVEGPSGSGRTSLLLSLTGRMKATEGSATVGEARLPKQLAAVRRLSALANVAGVTDLDPALTVGEHLRERALLQHRFGDSLRALTRPRAERAREAKQRIDTALDAAGLDLETLPKGPRTAVRDLERMEALRLSLALALIGGPRLLGIDDIDLKLSDAERAQVWDLLTALAASGTTVIAVCAEAPAGVTTVSTTAAPDGTDEDPTDEDATDEPGTTETGKTETTGKTEKGEEADALAETGRA
ncbi:ATP-binding cassette domain-containing protein [Streptomyces sp. NPDC086787]|uniref:ATP-binding cassette domain-containing protein n=1 Tax=Streptomyces sp. NPDC086787 TaxID=3365759 RepID=UPI00381BE131